MSFNFVVSTMSGLLFGKILKISIEYCKKSFRDLIENLIRVISRNENLDHIQCMLLTLTHVANPNSCC
jgi:hypothetical protein